MTEKFEFRNIRPDEAEQAVEIEQICFPPNEACSPKSMRKRTEHASETFLVAVDKATGKIAGFLNGVATDEEVFRDEFFTDITLHDPKGKNIMLLGLDVLPEYRHQVLARDDHDPLRARAAGQRPQMPVPHLPGPEGGNVTKKWATPTMASPVPSGEAKSGTI